MTTPYVDPNTVHNPATGTSPPATWGDTVRDNLETFARPPGCVVQRTATQSAANNVWTSVEFSATDLRDTDGYHDPSSNPSRMTVPTGLGGWYAIAVYVPFTQNATGFRAIRVQINGSTLVPLARQLANGTTYVELGATEDFRLSAGDYVEVQAFQSSGGALNLCPSSIAARASMRFVALP